MHEQPIGYETPRPSAQSVGDYYRSAFQSVYNRLMATEIRDDLRRPLAWNEAALLQMLHELADARAERLAAHKEPSEELARDLEKLTPDVRARLEFVFLRAEQLAALNTVLHWGWVANERLVKVGESLLDQLDAEGGQDA